MPSPATPVREPQSAGAVLMVRPARFAFNPQTAASNSLQIRTEAAGVGAVAVREFDALAAQLAAAGVHVVVAEDTPEPVKPDAVFPNNWVSFHLDGTVVLYPMLAPNRRLERREELVLQVTREGGYRALRIVDLSHREAEDRFLEGTGSLVLDRTHRVAFACLSPRTDLTLVGEFAQRLDFDPVAFEAFEAGGRPLYHTNVLMAIGTHFAVLCSEAIPDPARRAAVAHRLRSSGHELIEISLPQMLDFAANILELGPAAGTVIALSRRAWQAFHPAQRRVLERHGSIIAADIPVIERLGGGGVRCMLAEIHLPKY